MAEGSRICGRRCRNCRKCGLHYTKEQHDLWNCPECGEDRHCTQPGTGVGQGFQCEHCDQIFKGSCKRFHGGNAKVGMASPRFSHGRHSKYFKPELADKLPQRIRDTIAAIGEDALDLTDMAVILKARFYDLVSRTDRGESEELIKKAIRHCDELEDAQRKVTEAEKLRQAASAAGDLGGVAAAQATKESESQKATVAWNSIKLALKQNLEDWQTWSEAIHVAEKTTRVVESQRKALVESKLMLTIDRVEKMYGAMAEAVNRAVTDPEVLMKIQSEFRSIALHGMGEDLLLAQSEEEPPTPLVM